MTSDITSNAFRTAFFDHGMWKFIVIPYLLLIAFVIILRLLHKRKPSKRRPQNYKYQKIVSLLTPNELKFYKALAPVAQARKLIVCPKVRLADLIKPSQGQNYQAAFSRISSKHIDFVLCDINTFQPVLAVELDDSTHDRKDRIERDDFVDKALKQAAIPILHTRNSNELAKKITDAISAQRRFKE